jgi:hypothetical protein
MMARILIHIHRYFEQPNADEWLHVPRYLASKGVVEPGGDVGKLAHWGLLDALSGERPDGCKHNGFYKITPLGIQFVRREVQVPKYIFLYNQTVYGFSNGSDRPMDLEVKREMTDIREALGRKFNYAELMGLDT